MRRRSAEARLETPTVWEDEQRRPERFRRVKPALETRRQHESSILRLRQGPLFIVLYYRPPSSASTFDDLEDALVPLTPSQLKSCILLGDFNVDLLLNNQLSNDLTAMLSSFHFTQVVGEPTRYSLQSLDWTGGLDWWTGLKIIFMLANENSPVELHLET